MSGISISLYFPFVESKLPNRRSMIPPQKALIDVVPDRRFQPICHRWCATSLIMIAFLPKIG